MRSFPFFFRMVNQRDQYDELEGSYVPDAILSRMILMTSLYMPGGIGMFLSAHGMCWITGILRGGKKSSQKRPF